MSPALKVRRRKCNIVIWVSYCGTFERRARSGRGRYTRRRQSANWRCGEAWKAKKKCRGASLRGQGSPGFILPASAVSEQENCVGANRKTPFCSGFVSTNPDAVEKPTTSLRRRAEIRSVRWRPPLRPMFRRGTRCAVRGQGSEHGPDLRE